MKPFYANIVKNNANIVSISIDENTNRTGKRAALQQKLQFSFRNIQEADLNHRQGNEETHINKNRSIELAALKGDIEELKQQKQNRYNTGGKTKNQTNNTSKNLKNLQHPKKPARGL